MSNLPNDGSNAKWHHTENLHFTGLIPALYDPELDSDSFRIHCIIYGMINSYGYCNPSNAWISDRIQKSERVVSRCITSLKKAGYIQTRIEATANGSIRKIYRGKKAMPGQSARLLPNQPSTEPPKAEGLFSEEPKRKEVTEPIIEEDSFIKAARIIYKLAYPTRQEWETFEMNSPKENRRTVVQLREELQRYAERFVELEVIKMGESEAAALANISKMSHGRVWANYRRTWLTKPYRMEKKNEKPSHLPYQKMQ